MFAVGDNGTVVHNGVATQLAPIGSDGMPESTNVLISVAGDAAGNVLIGTESDNYVLWWSLDGGQSFTQWSTPPDSGLSMAGIAKVGSFIAIANESDVVNVSGDNGLTWANVDLVDRATPNFEDADLYGIFALNAHAVYVPFDACGTQCANIYVMTDPTTLTFHALSPTPLPADLWAVWGTSAQNLFAVGDNGTVLHSADGTTFTTQLTPTTDSLISVSGDAAGNAIAVAPTGTIIQYR